MSHAIQPKGKEIMTTQMDRGSKERYQKKGSLLNIIFSLNYLVHSFTRTFFHLFNKSTNIYWGLMMGKGHIILIQTQFFLSF